MKASIRALGVLDGEGKLLTATDASRRKRDSSTRLTEISLEQISDHLVMIYFNDFDPGKLDYAVSAFEKKYDLKLRPSKDKRGRDYYWRVITPKGGKRSKKASYASNDYKESRRAYWRRKHPEVEHLQYEDHWIDLADELGCDPITLAQNLD